jgi:hypothetical protein
VNTPNLKSATQGYASLKERLLAEHPDLDDETLLDTLEGASDLKEQLVIVVRSALENETYAEALKLRIEAMRSRLGRLEGSARKKRSLVAECMSEAGLKKLTEPDFTCTQTYTKGGVVISDEAQLPNFLIREKVIREPDKTAIRNALAQGPIPGASLSNGYATITVRVY